MNDKMYEHSKFILDRLDRQYDKVNMKINLYIAINAVIITILTFLIKYTDPPIELWWLCIPYYIIFIFTITLTIWTITLLIHTAAPYLPDKSEKKGDGKEEGIPKIAIDILTENKSFVYFGHISTHNNSFFNNYVESFKNNTDNMNADILSQIYTLSLGLVKRNDNLKRISRMMIVSMILIAILLVFNLFFA